MKQDHLNRLTRIKNTLLIALACSLLVGSTQLGVAQMLPVSGINAQLLDGSSPQNRFIVLHTGGVSGINLTCLLLACQVVQGLGDPDGQLFVVQAPQIFDSTVFLTQLLSVTGVASAEPDQTVNTLSATVSTMPSYAYDRTQISYYGASVWEGYVLQTPNQIVRTAQTQAAFGVSGQGTIVALIDTG